MKKYCFYYKGEKENPHKPGTDINRWWWYEEGYFFKGLPGDHEKWEDLAIKAANDIPAIEFLMCAADVPVETKGFLAWSVGTTLGHNPYESFQFFREYGRGFLPEHLYTGEVPDFDYSDEALYGMCRYYKGGDQNPYEVDNPRYTYWEVEMTWFKLVANNPDRRKKYLIPFLLAFDGGLPGFPVDETIKATLYEHFIHFGGSKDAFCQFLTDYVNLAS